MHSLFLFIFNLLLFHVYHGRAIFIGNYPPGCDVVAAQKCEDDFLNCHLYLGNEFNDATMCNCGYNYYSKCLPLAGCETAKQVGPFTDHLIYLKTCVDLIIQYNCPDPLICALNCASDIYATTNTTNTNILPINNYGEYHLRIRLCMNRIDTQVLDRYSIMQVGFCKNITEYISCSRFIPPHSFIPVIIPSTATSIAIDSCTISSYNGSPTYNCVDSGIPPYLLYGNDIMFPPSFDVFRTNTSGSYCLRDG